MSVSVLGQNIQKIRKSKQMSALALSKEAGVGTSTISEIESGVRQSLQSRTIKKIANALDVNTDKLFEFELHEEYIVEDLEDVLTMIFSSDELSLENTILSIGEKDLLRKGFSEKISELILLRNLFKCNSQNISEMTSANELIEYRNKILHR